MIHDGIKASMRHATLSLKSTLRMSVGNSNLRMKFKFQYCCKRIGFTVDEQCKVSIMSDIPTNKPLGILKTSNRNDNFKVPSLGVSKPEKEQNKSWHYNTTPRPTKAVNNENINPNGNFPESTKETPGKTIFELCKQMSALALLTPDGMQQSTRDTQAQPKKVKLPFSEPFAGVDKLVEKDYLSDPEEIEPDNVPRKTLVITDDDEFFTDASEYFKNEDLNIDNTSDNDAFKSLESSPRTSLNVAGTLMKNNNSGERDSESAIIGIDETQEASLPEKISDKNIHEKLEYIEPEINSDLFNEAIHNQNIGNLSESHENKNPSSQVICIEPETVAEHHAEDFTNLPKDAKLTNSTDVENGDYLKIIDQNSDSIPIDEKSVNVIKSVETANDSSNASTNESYILQPPLDEKQNTDILDVCKVEEKIAEISIPEKFDHFNAEDKSKDRTPDSSSVNTSEISNQINESVATGSTKTDKNMSDSETTLMTVQTEEKISGAKETVDSLETEIANCLTLKEKIPEEKSSDNVEHFECSPKIDAANVDAEKTEENNSNLLESQNVECSHESPKPQSTEENTSGNAQLSKAIDNASVAENVEIKKPVADIGRPVDEKPVPQSSVNAIQSVEMPNDSSDPLTMDQPPVDKKQNTDILDTCKVQERIAEISIPENFDYFNDEDKSKDRTPDSDFVASPEISNQINESVATSSTKTDKNMLDNETTLMTVQTEEKISGAKETVDSLETGIANCLTPKEKSSDNVEHFECSSKIGTANVDAEKTEENNSNLLESQNVECSHESPKPQSTEENPSGNAQLSKAIDNASVAENVEIKKPVADIGRPVDEKPVPQSSVNAIQSVEMPNDSSDPLTMDQPPVDKKQNTDILDTCKVQERIAEISIPENFDYFNDEDKSKDRTPDSDFVASPEISNQINESVATGSTKTDKNMLDSETTLMTVQTEEKISGAKETVDSLETGIANCLTPKEKSSENVEHFECSSKIGTANVDAEKTEENNSNLLESQNVECSHESPKPQSTEENTSGNAQLSKAIDNASVAENVEIKKPVADIGRPVDEKPVPQSSVNVIQSVETPNDSSDPLTMDQPPVDKKQNTDILDTYKVEEKIAEISIPENFDHFNDEDKSKDRTPDSGSVAPPEISNQINESVATGSTKTNKNMLDSETTLMTVQTEEKISGAKETVDSLETGIANCLTPKEKSSDNVEHFECSSKIDTANVDAENNSNLLESQNVESSHESPKPQSTEENTRENAQLSKAIDNASVAENVEINKPVADIGRPVDEQPVLHSSVNVIQSVETANDSSDTSTNESYILQPPLDEKQNTDILDVCHVKEKIAEISVPEKFDNFNAEDKSKDRTTDSSSVDTSEISNQINESVAAGSTKTDKNMSGSETTLMTVQTEEKISGAKETVDSLETEIANCLTSKEKSSDNVEHFECSSKIGTANVDAEKNEEDNSNLLESQNTDCSHGNPKPQSTEENTSVNAHLSKAIDNASVAENVEIKKPVADIGRPVDEKPFLHSSVNVIQSVETPNDSSYPLTMESNSIQLPVDEKQNTDILDTCKVEEKIAEISVPETFDNFNDQDKSKDRTPDSDFVGPPEISNQINESVATGSTKTDKNMLDSETTLMTVQTEEKISGAKETVDSLETGIANCLTSKEKSSDNVEHFECSSKIGTANVDAENNSNLLESQNVDCSHESPKPQSTEENTSRNAQLSKAIDNASVAENVEIKKPVSDIGRPVDEKPVPQSSVNVIQSVETPNDSSDPLTMAQPPVDEKQNTDILDTCKVEERIAEISIPENFDYFNDEDKSKDRTPDSSSVGSSEISNQIHESVATGSTKTDKHMSASETTLMTVQTEEKISGAKEFVDSFETGIANCLTTKEKIPEEKSSDNVEHFECSSKIGTANVDAEKTEEKNSNLLESQNVDCSHGYPKPQLAEENTHENAPLSKAIDNASVAENVEIKKPVADIGRPNDIEEEVMESSEVKDASDHSKINCEIPNSIAASDDNLQKFEIISNPSVFKDVDTFSTNTHLLNSPKSIQGSQSNIDISFEGRTQMANSPVAAVAVENDIQIDITPTSPNKQQQVGNGKHAGSQSRQNINEKPNRKELNEITDLVTAVNDTHICEDDISTILKGAEPSDSAETANYDEQEPNIQFEEKTNGFICDDDDWELLNCDKTVVSIFLSL
ncbi:Hypothetical predicted protein [Octopus vulgaris]|uniref:Uncharacterized protein n=1 Tax=Octopus vulgaris TaxID=6645 RepID=A0AA36F0G5_OCTVU|nr:Hypothetical predicted protein [Octopus vulgaris]